MKERTITWIKNGTKMPRSYLVCDCGGDIRLAGVAQCVHHDSSTIFIQCKQCKDVTTWDDYCRLYLLDEDEKHLGGKGWIKDIKS